MDKENIIVTRKLSKTFSSHGFQTHVLRNIDMEIRRGDFTIVMGTSGSGKSTLLYALSGIDAPSLGTIRFAGEELTEKSNDQLAMFRRTNCGFVFQQIHLCDSMSLMDNVLACGYLVDKSRQKVVSRAKQLFLRVGLNAQDWRKFPAQVSGGEAQRAALVRALINKPTMLFADEPTGSLNSTASAAVLDLLTEANLEGQSVVLVTHDLTTALRGNRVLYLQDGVIAGECDLGKYQDAKDREDMQARRDILTQLLSQMGW